MRINGAGVGYDVLPDGRFVMTRHPNRSTSREIVLVRNWLSELKRAVSTEVGFPDELLDCDRSAREPLGERLAGVLRGQPPRSC